MPAKYVHTSIDGRKLKLSNLDKLLYPNLEVTKAQVIQYYIDVSDLLLEYIKDRPLTVIRFPDGISGTSFYSKDKPDWTPDWVNSTQIEHEEKSIDYILASNKATIAWLANLACLELHPMQFEVGIGQPDFFVVDLDPDEQLGFEKVKETAYFLREFLRGYGYHPYLKTSGGKGLHLYIPLIPRVDFDQALSSIKALAAEFVKKNTNLYTLQVSKAKRKGRILIDIYRNHMTNTTVAPFSLRGKMGAPVSMPIKWEHLESLDHSAQYHIGNYKEYLEEYGNPWKDWREHAVEFHNLRKQSISLDANEDLLEEYSKKRDFKKTSEPAPIISKQFKDHFVIQLHDASNLHYDLRLEDQGVLKSWAIPKGLPFKKNQKRLAIQTEDHPIQYLNFEGVIPKGEYGAGQMWIVDKGKIDWIKKSEDSFHFRLKSKKFKGAFKLFRTKESEQWLITCSDDQSYYNVHQRIEPMLASASKVLPKSKEYVFEVKWDGIRVILYWEADQLFVFSRNGRDITSQFPELQNLNFCKLEHAVLDGELVVLDEKGRPKFHDVISRMHQRGESSIQKLMRSKPITCYLFDLISIDGLNIDHLDFTTRNEWLNTAIKTNATVRISSLFENGSGLFEAIKAQGMEGVMAKTRVGRYETGKRSKDWIKIKSRTRDECTIIGYTKGQGDRSSLFGALHVAKYSDEDIVYMGKVGTGFDQKKLKHLFELLLSLQTVQKPIEDKIEEEYRSVWVEPKLMCEIEYASLSSNGTYREPVFIKLKSDL